MPSDKKIIIIYICIFAVCVLFFALLVNNKNNESKITDDEIVMKIKLDTKEDVGLIVYDYSVGGFEHSGGISNADKSLIKNNDLIIQPMSKQLDFDNLSDIEDLTIKFRIITEYVDPNYDNIYPEEYTKIIEPSISLKAQYGEVYFIIISGDKTNGYKVTLEE